MNEQSNASNDSPPVGMWLTVVLSILITSGSAPKFAENFGYVGGAAAAFATGTLLFIIGVALGKLGSKAVE